MKPANTKKKHCPRKKTVFHKDFFPFAVCFLFEPRKRKAIKKSKIATSVSLALFSLFRRVETRRKLKIEKAENRKLKDYVSWFCLCSATLIWWLVNSSLSVYEVFSHL